MKNIKNAKNENVRFHLYLRKDLINKLKKVALEKGVSVSAYLNLNLLKILK